MEEERKNQKIVNHYSEIPEIFHSEDTGQPLKNCLMCGKNVYEKGVPYVIEKAFRYHKKFDLHETIFEYAICYDCYEKMGLSLSPESMQKLQSYFSRHMNMVIHRKHLLNQGNLDLNEWIGKCAIKGTDIKESDEYQLCCQCEGPEMLYSHLPMAISEEAIMEITEQLSAKTKDELDRFQDEFLGLPPELKELFKDRSLILV